jgi:ubiquitin-protein ligase
MATDGSDDSEWATVAAPIDSGWLANLFPTKSEAKRAQWLSLLLENEFETQDDLRALDAPGWEALPLPLAVKSAVRLSLEPADEGVPPIIASPVVATMDVAPPSVGPTPAIAQCDIIVIDISASMRAHSSLDPCEGHAGTADGSISGSDYDPSTRETTTSTRRTREDISKILFHTMIDKTLVFELSHAVGLLAFGKEVLPMAITCEYERFHDELGRLDASQCGTRLYDSIVAAADMLTQHCAAEGLDTAAKRVFVLTDGEDNMSSSRPWSVAQHLQRSGITLDAIPLAGMNTTLAALCHASGGLCFDVDSQEQGIGLFEREATLQLCAREVATEPPPTISDDLAFDSFVRSINSDPARAVARVVKSVVPKAAFAPVMSAATVQAKMAAASVALSGASDITSGTGALKRALKEYGSLASDPAEGWRVFVSEDDPLSWKAVMERGEPSPEWLQSEGVCPYATGTWLLTVDIPQEYPFKAPRVRFVTPIYHCNVSVDGMICLDLLKDAWSPALSIRKVLEAVRALVMSPDGLNPLDAYKGALFKDDLPLYKAEATKHTLENAQEGFDVLSARYNLAPAADPA